ncbi:electron transfer flavoprotein subunit beta/FixA family protein [Frisingicoccus caecimuris]|uniref:Electron transfer flavoprotein small subunit n=1 Tax=Frisingicoccus caecimuris TaxID=1796636 RepID=A0A4R2L9E1_9FIRM|nr:electron transfer flavoprotein subunit beta/FixA family protein [Frisingicoccus caecimuris]MCR1919207.1 electron transfer flavoprotein subunit beta/FixA family protein [Frisingicoccus caecimuris]TCO84343.1 electron transfer flavoprotein beta subunit [Frisingicoccus caecimuris]
MDILVCVKQVPDTTEIKINYETNTLIREGVPSIVNPFDAYALEVAVRLKEKHGGTVTVLSMGPDQAKAALKECLSVGADKAYLLSDRAFGGSDTLATSYILASAIHSLGKFDLIMCGKQAIDGDTAQVGPEIAEHLDIPQVTYALDADVTEDGKVIVKKETETGYEMVETQIPALLTVVKTEFEPRMASVKAKIAANRKPIDVITSQDITIDLSRAGLKGSPTKVKKTYTPPMKGDSVVIKEETAKESVDKLISILDEKSII